ncbi:hypothetical protein [Streptomyces sp. NRRL F-5135]|uniref:hypothetical protein n=1 Tax=Streptomyces sp. NRRL F-5135 TaxID=1463858 RepID=UPI0004C63509|nr:hypothetical protein [Streptomyces sp. NRRL F-5135]
MEAELAALSASGATTVVSLMATDGWNIVRSRVAALLRRDGRTREDRVEDELEAECREVAAARAGADTAAVADLEAVWRARFRRLLSEDPAAVTVLRDLIEQSPPAPRLLRNTIHGGEFHQKVVQTGDIGGDLNLS